MLRPLLPFIGAAFAAQGWEYFDFNFNLKPIIWTQDAAKKEEAEGAKAGADIKKEDIALEDKPISKEKIRTLEDYEREHKEKMEDWRNSEPADLSREIELEKQIAAAETMEEKKRLYEILAKHRTDHADSMNYVDYRKPKVDKINKVSFETTGFDNDFIYEF